MKYEKDGGRLIEDGERKFVEKNSRIFKRKTLFSFSTLSTQPNHKTYF